MESKVVISVDPRFSPIGSDQNSDFWVVASEANVQTVMELRKNNRVNSITTFSDLGDDVENVASMLPTIIEHHARATTIVVRGINIDAHIDVIRANPASWMARSTDGDVTIERA